MYDELGKRLRSLAGMIPQKHTLPSGADTVICSLEAFMQVKELAEEAANAIEELSKQIEAVQCVNIGDLDCDSNQLCTCMGIVRKQLEADAKKPRWIPVTERLPSYGDWVLGIGPKKGYHVCEFRGITHFPYSGDSPWFSAKGRSLTITHWMPLPEPPKEEA